MKRFVIRWRGPLITGFYLFLFAACGLAIAAMIGPEGRPGVMRAIAGIGWLGITLAILSTCMVFTTMWVMEQVSLHDSGAPPHARKMVVTPLVSNAMSFGVGFGAVSGAALRVQLYARNNIDAASAIFVASSVTLMSILGGFLVAALGFAVGHESILAAVPLQPGILQIIGIAMLTGFAGLIAAAGLKGRILRVRGREFKLPSALGLVIRIGLGAIDWLFSAAVLFFLLPSDTGLSFATFASVFAGAHAIAMTTGAPAGIGVFDTIMLSLTPPGVTPEGMAAALIVYRLISLAAPMALAIIALTILEWSFSRRAAIVTGEPPLGALEAIPLPRPSGRKTHWFLHSLAKGLGMTHTYRAPGFRESKGDLFERAARTEVSSLNEIAGAGPILVLAPHPDDEILGCGGLIAACAANGVAVHVAILTDGGRSHLGSREWPNPRIAEARQQEAFEALRCLGVERENVNLLALPDGSLFRSARARRLVEHKLCRIAQRIGAQRMFVTWRHDPHPDHIAASAIAENVQRRLAHLSLVQYPVWGSFLPDATRLRDHDWKVRRLDVSAHLDAKMAALDAYKTQVRGLITDARIVRAVTPAQLRALMGPHEIFFE